MKFASQVPEAEPELLEQTLSAIQDIEDDRNRAWALAKVAPKLPESERLQVLEQALTLTRGLKSQDSCDLLIVLSRSLPEFERLQVLEESLTVALTTGSERQCANVLITLAPHLPEQLLRQAIHVSQTIQKDMSARAKALASISLQLPEADRLHILKYALASAQELLLDQEVPDNKHSQALAMISPQLPEQLLQQALETAQSSWKKPAFMVILRILSPYCSQNLIEKSLTFVQEQMLGDSHQASALAVLTPHLSKSLLEKALSSALDIDEKWSRIHALSALASRFSDMPNLLEVKRIQILQELSQATQNIERDWDQLKNHSYNIDLGLLSAAPQLLEPALKASINSGESNHNKSVDLEIFAPHINPFVLRIFLEATLNLKIDELERILVPPATRLTEDFAQIFPSEKHSIALNIVHKMDAESDKVKFLSALIPHLSLRHLSEALKIIETTFVNDLYRTEALSNLLPYMPNHKLPEAFELITNFIQDPWHKVSAIEALLPLLGGALFDYGHGEIFEKLKDLVLELPLPQLQARILYAIANEFHTEEANQLFYGYGVEFLDLSKNPQNCDIISDIFDITKSLRDVDQVDFSYERWASKIFKKIAPTLRRFKENKNEEEKLQEKLNEILESVRQLKDSGFQAEVIAAFPHHQYFVSFARECCPYSPEADSYQLLRRTKIQLNLPFTGRPKLNAIYDVLKAKAEPYIIAEALVEDARCSKGFASQSEALKAVTELANLYLKNKYLQRLIPELERQNRLEAVSVIGDIEDAYYRAAARVALARKFPESEFFIPARDAVLALESRVQQIEQLSMLAIDMPELLPRIIKISEELDTGSQTESSNSETVNGREAFLAKIERRDILVALAPHLPMRINREVNRECTLGHFVSQELYHRALYLLARGYRDALQGGTLRNDVAQDKDLLDLKDEVNALSGLLLMRDLEPPMTVGILGGWGGGKSYIMHLMQAQMTAIRSRKVDVDVEAWNPNPSHEKLSPYVGHIYQIKFDAWTFAKSDLWASLMQTIFTELDRQITLEQQLMSVLEKVPDAQRQALEEKIWPVLYETNDSDRKWFLERVLNDAALLDEFQSQLTNPELTGFLWKKFQTSQDAAISSFTQLQAELKKAESQLNLKKAEIREREHAQFRPVVELQNSKQAQRIDALLGTSLIVLRQRIGTPLFQRLNNEVYKELKGNAAAPDADAQKGLWKTLNETIQEYEQVSKGIVELETKEDTGQDLDQLKEKSGELLQQIENTKFDIYTVAATVIDREYGRITLTSGWQWARRNWVLISIFVLFFVVPVAALVVISSMPEFEIPVLQWAKDLIDRGDRSIAGLAAFLATLTPGIIAFQAMLKTAQKWFEETSLALQEYQKGVENRAKALEATIEQKIAATIQTDAELQRLENTVKQLESQVRSKQAEMPENVYASLADFVSGRLQEGSYEGSSGSMVETVLANTFSFSCIR